LLTVAIPVFDEVQVAHVVKSCTVPSARVPEAINSWVHPGAMLGGDDGVIAMNATGDVARVVDPMRPPEAAVMVVEPMFNVAVARP
jgi:hypothetical protein